MMSTKGAQLVSDFIQALNAQNGIMANRTVISRNVFEFNGKGKSLLYVKGRAEHPYRWGVTANVINSLQAQPKNWMVILLFESHEKGYLLNSRDVEYYIHKVWPLGTDGDYKPATGPYLSRNMALNSMLDFIKEIEMNSTAKGYHNAS